MVELKKDSTVNDLVELFNTGVIKYQDIMNLFGVSRDLIKDRLTSIGLHYDNKAKRMLGEAIEEDLNTQLEKLFEKQRKKQPNKDAVKKAYASNELATAIEAPVNESKINTSKSELNASQTELNSGFDSIDILLMQNEIESGQRTYRGFYWDKDIINFLDNVKHGNKSDLMNEIVRTILKAKGLM